MKKTNRHIRDIQTKDVKWK